MEVEVGEDERHGGYYDGDDVALGLEKIREHGDKERYAENHREEALPVGEGQSQQAGYDLEGAAAVGESTVMSASSPERSPRTTSPSPSRKRARKK